VVQGGQSASGQKFFDVGATYGSTLYNYFVIINQDFQTVRGIEISLRRRLFNYWGFNINYAYSQATTNAAAPENQFENRTQGQPANNREITSEVDIPHVFNASLFFRVANEAPFGMSVPDAIVRNANLTLTLTARSGFPYTPQLSFTGFGDQKLEENSGRGPPLMNVDLLLAKDFNLTNLRWGVFARVTNLLDAKNCIQVFPTTGQCVGGTVDQAANRTGNATNAYTSTFLDRPQYTDTRRQINFGARMSF
jgi:hypothetical protein